MRLRSPASTASATTTFAQDFPKEIRVGLLGGENEADRLKNNACLVDHLKADFGADKVTLFPAADYDGVIQGLLGGTIDVAELGASGYARACTLQGPEGRHLPGPHHPGSRPGSTGYFTRSASR